MNELFDRSCKIESGGCATESSSPDVIVIQTRQGASYRTSTPTVESIRSLVQQRAGDAVIRISLAGACRAWFWESDDIRARLSQEVAELPVQTK